jgi:hypothetical protein
MKHLLPDHQRYGSHDRRAAALKAKRASPWRRGNVDTPTSRKLREKWKREGSLRQ